MQNSNKAKTNLSKHKNRYVTPKVRVEKVRIPVWAGSSTCLSSKTMISTPNGSVNITDLKVNDLVWSVNGNMQKSAVPVIKTSSRKVDSRHIIIKLVLKDGRRVFVSPHHPDYNGRPVYQLRKGNTYDGSMILEKRLQVYSGKATYDILPDSESQLYWANGILIGSTLSKKYRHGFSNYKSHDSETCFL